MPVDWVKPSGEGLQAFTRLHVRCDDARSCIVLVQNCGWLRMTGLRCRTPRPGCLGAHSALRRPSLVAPYRANTRSRAG